MPSLTYLHTGALLQSSSLPSRGYVKVVHSGLIPFPVNFDDEGKRSSEGSTINFRCMASLSEDTKNDTNSCSLTTLVRMKFEFCYRSAGRNKKKVTLTSPREEHFCSFSFSFVWFGNKIQPAAAAVACMRGFTSSFHRSGFKGYIYLYNRGAKYNPVPQWLKRLFCCSIPFRWVVWRWKKKPNIGEQRSSGVLRDKGGDEF